MIRLLAVDDHPVVRSGLAGMLDVEADLEVAGEAGDGERAQAWVALVSPDVVLMDLRMPRMDGADIGRRLNIGEAMVKTHLRRTFAELGVDDRTRAVTVAMEKGILPAP